MSTVKSKKLQVGTDATATNNFTIYQPATPDGTLRIGVGNADSPTEVAQFNSTGITLATGKDLTLSSTPLDASASGIYLGGTSASNLLDDYEEGEWTPTDASGAGLSFTTNNDNWYVKVGNLVTVSFDFTFPSTASTAQAEINLPFVMNANNTAGGIINWSNSGSNDTIHAFPNKMIFMYNGNSSRTNVNYSGDRIIGAFTYQTT